MIVDFNRVYYPRLMRISLLFITLCLSLPVAGKDVYKSVDEHGNVIFSDVPTAGAEKVQVDEIQTVPAETATFTYTPPVEELLPYTKIAIISPPPDSVVQYNEGNQDVVAVVEPSLNAHAGHQLVLYLDGVQAATGVTPQFKLSGLERGTHTLSVAVIDKDGNQLTSSPTVSFTVFQHSILPPPKPPPPKPPPKK